MTDIAITDWYLLRHAAVAGAPEGIQASADEPADLSNKAALARLAGALPSGALWWSSPLSRCRATARALQQVKACERPVQFDERLREQHFGALYGLSFAEAWRRIEPLPAHNWSMLAADSAPPEGDRFIDLWARVGDFIDDAGHRKELGRPRVLVTHAGVVRAFVGQALGLSPETALVLSVEPLSLSHLRAGTGRGRGGAWQLLCLNRLA